MKRRFLFGTGFRGLSGDFQKIVSNLAWLLGDRIFRMSLSLVVGVWVARYLGPQDFGLYNYAIAIIGMFGSFANLGLNNLVIRDLAGISSAADGTPHSISTGKNRLLGTTSSLRLMGGCCCCCCLDHCRICPFTLLGFNSERVLVQRRYPGEPFASPSRENTSTRGFLMGATS